MKQILKTKLKAMKSAECQARELNFDSEIHSSKSCGWFKLQEITTISAIDKKIVDMIDSPSTSEDVESDFCSSCDEMHESLEDEHDPM